MKTSKLLALVLSMVVIGAMMIVGVSAVDFTFQGSCKPATSVANQNRWGVEVTLSDYTGVTCEPGQIKVEFFNGEDKIATVVNGKSIELVSRALSVNLQIGVDNSSSWDQDTLNLDPTKAPTSAKIYYNGELKDEKTLSCDPDIWAAKYAGVPHVSLTPHYSTPNVYFSATRMGVDLKFPNSTVTYVVGAIELELYCDDVCLTTITNARDISTTANDRGAMIDITANLCFGDEDSSSWDQTAVNLKRDQVPNRVVLKVNGEKFDEVTLALDAAVWNSMPGISTYKRIFVRDYEAARQYVKTIYANEDNAFNYTKPGYEIEGLYSDETLINKVVDGNVFNGDNAAVAALPNTLYIKWVPTAETQKQMKLVAVRGIVLTMIMPEYDIEIADVDGVTVTYTGKMTPGEDKFAFCDSWSAEWAVEEGYTLNKVLVNGEEYDAANYNVKWNDTDVTIEFDVTAPVVEEEVVEEEVVEEEVVEETTEAAE